MCDGLNALFHMYQKVNQSELHLSIKLSKWWVECKFTPPKNSAPDSRRIENKTKENIYPRLFFFLLFFSLFLLRNNERTRLFLFNMSNFHSALYSSDLNFYWLAIDTTAWMHCAAAEWESCYQSENLVSSAHLETQHLWLAAHKELIEVQFSGGIRTIHMFSWSWVITGDGWALYSVLIQGYIHVTWNADVLV